MLLVGAVFLSSPRAETQGPHRGAGISKEQYLALMGGALEEIGKGQAAARSGHRVQIHANLFLAHEAFIASTPLSTLERAVDAFKEARVSQVDLNVGLYPWVSKDKAAIEKYDAVVERIRRAGMRVAVNPQYSPVRHKVRSLEQWRREALPVYREIAGRYKPDVFVVVHEPTTMAARMGVQRSKPKPWVEFAREAAKVVREKSPRSRIGAGGLAAEQKFFEAFAGMKEIDVLTLDIYDLKSLPIYAEMVRTARGKGKPVYVEETWRPPYFQLERGMSLDQISAKSVGDRSFEQLDVRWIRMIAGWAAAQGVEGVTPVWMQTFFAYGGDGTEAFDKDYLQRVMAAIDKGERTATFEALREIAR
jgi:hypothetical protein